LKNSANPKNNIRDVFFGYLTVFVSYIIVGCLGYLGFTGERFDSRPHSEKTGIIEIT